MDNQKSNEGKGSDASRESSGASMGKDLSGRSEGKGTSGAGSTGASSGTNATPGSASAATSTSTGAVGGTSNMATPASSAAGSSGSMSGNSTGNMGSSTGGAGMSSSDTGMSGTSGKGITSMNKEDMHKTIDKAAQAAQPMVDRLVNTAHASVDKMSGMLSGASQTMGERSQQLNEAYQNAAESGREYVRNNPGSAVLMALGAGFLLAKLFGGSSRGEYRSEYRDRDYRDYRD
jgi:ElaB/YqjD/DUF883 family membrane-anchored ribosome-binding protein